jgi:hypothetical protein
MKIFWQPRDKNRTIRIPGRGGSLEIMFDMRLGLLDERNKEVDAVVRDRDGNEVDRVPMLRHVIDENDN